MSSQSLLFACLSCLTTVFEVVLCETKLALANLASELVSPTEVPHLGLSCRGKQMEAESKQDRLLCRVEGVLLDSVHLWKAALCNAQVIWPLT